MDLDKNNENLPEQGSGVVPHLGRCIMTDSMIYSEDLLKTVFKSS